MSTKKILGHVHRAVSHIPHPGKKKATKLAVGSVVMIVGVIIAKNPYHLMHHYAADMIGYAVHGYGAIPFLKVLCAKFDLEHLEEEDEKEAVADLTKQLLALQSEVARLKERNNA